METVLSRSLVSFSFFFSKKGIREVHFNFDRAFFMSMASSLQRRKKSSAILLNYALLLEV